MNDFTINLLDWSEVWAPLIPLTIFLIRKPTHYWKKPIVVYLVTALTINFTIDFLYHPLMEYKILDSNYVFYNLNSIVRLVLFTWFFGYMHSFFKKLNRFVPWLFLLIALLNFTLLESVFDFSSNIMALEAAINLVYCLIWFYLKIKGDDDRWLFSYRYTWVVTGISLYSAINFFLFLFYKTLIASENEFIVYHFWDVHNISFTIMCILIAVSFYKNEK